jgi:hypothetical protein
LFAFNVLFRRKRLDFSQILVKERALMTITSKSIRVILIVGASILPAQATTFFVNPGGSDFSPGTQSQPFRTIQKAIAATSAGDSVIVSAGTYNETVNFNRSGSSGARITVTASGVVKIAGPVSVTGNYCTLDGFQCGMSSLSGYPPAFQVYGSNNVLKNCVVDIPNTSSGIATAFDLDGNQNLIYKCTVANINDTDSFHIFGDRNVIDSCIIHDSTNPNYSSGAHADCFQSWGGMSNCTIQNCTVWNINHQLGILNTAPGGTSSTVHDNTFRNNVIIASQQFFLFQANMHVYNNTWYKCADQVGNPIYLNLDSAGSVFKNNVFFGCGGSGGNYPNQGGFSFVNISNVTIDHNFFANTDFSPKNAGIAIGTNSINGGNPRFVNAAGLDFHIQQGSVLIAAGTNITPNFPDKDGNARPFSGPWDIGAYQYVSASTPAPSPVPTTSSAPKYVQGAYSTPQTPQSTVSVRFSSGQAAGDLNVVIVGWNDASTQVSSVTDSLGNTYRLAVGPTKISGGVSQSIYYAPNISASAPGSNVVRVTFTSAANYPDIRAMEYNGVTTSNPLDAVAQGTGNNSYSSSNNLATTAANDILVSGNTVSTQTTGAGAPSIQRLLTTPDGDIAQDCVLVNAGTYSAAAPLRSPGIWVMQAVAFRSANP